MAGEADSQEVWRRSLEVEKIIEDMIERLWELDRYTPSGVKIISHNPSVFEIVMVNGDVYLGSLFQLNLEIKIKMRREILAELEANVALAD
jgi:hypothetical protein